MEQQQLLELTRKFPTPRLQTDNGNQDLADLHVRESLLLDHYSWIDRSQGKVRIPIERAMELIAQHGLPVIPGPSRGICPPMARLRKARPWIPPAVTSSCLRPL